MEREFMDEIDRDLIENGTGEPPFIRLAKAEQRVRELTASERHLRVELAEAKKRAETAEAELSGHIGKQALKEMLRQMLANAEKAESLKAQVARLRAGLGELKAEYEGAGMHDEERRTTYIWSLSRINTFLAETPAQSIAAIKAEALRELAAEWRGIEWSVVTFTMAESAKHFAGMAESRAARLEREAKNGKA